MKNFRIQLIARVLLLAASTAAAVLLVTLNDSYVAAGFLVVTIVVQVAALVRVVDRTNREVARFLRSVRYSDFSQSFSEDRWGRSFRELNDSITEVMDDFRSARAETEEHYQFLNTVMQHIGVGLISFQRDGSVGLINNSAKRLLRVQHLKNIASLTSFSRDLVAAMAQIRSGEKAIVKVVLGDELLELILYGTEFRLRGQQYTLVSIQDIQMELEEKEIEAWQKLTRVLTHEIMNSITPIASLAATINELIEEEPDAARLEKHAEDIGGAVRTIERRSQNLLRFVQAYRSLTRIPRPNLRIFSIRDLFESVEMLFRTELLNKNIDLQMRIDPEELDLTADQELIEQILINLVRNAMQAVDGWPDAQIRMVAFLGDRGRSVIQVSDNGPGIEPEAMEKIFIPFFTTKKDGSGIGLSLSRQIMRQHAGTMAVSSEPDRKTTFTLRF